MLQFLFSQTIDAVFQSVSTFCCVSSQHNLVSKHSLWNQRSLNSFWYIYLKKSFRDQMFLRDHEYGPPMDRLCCWIALSILFGCSPFKLGISGYWSRWSFKAIKLHINRFTGQVMGVCARRGRSCRQRQQQRSCCEVSVGGGEPGHAHSASLKRRPRLASKMSDERRSSSRCYLRHLFWQQRGRGDD